MPREMTLFWKAMVIIALSLVTLHGWMLSRSLDEIALLSATREKQVRFNLAVLERLNSLESNPSNDPVIRRMDARMDARMDNRRKKR